MGAGDSFSRCPSWLFETAATAAAVRISAHDRRLAFVLSLNYGFSVLSTTVLNSRVLNMNWKRG